MKCFMDLGEIEGLAGLGVPPSHLLCRGGYPTVTATTKEVIAVIEVHLTNHETVSDDRYVIVRHTLGSPNGAPVVQASHNVEQPAARPGDDVGRWRFRVRVRARERMGIRIDRMDYD